jgi:hypothetical protein
MRKAYESVLMTTLEETVGPRAAHQHGFTPGKSIWGPIWALHTELREDSLRRRCTQVMFVDIKKAYDTVDRNLLWEKLYRRAGGSSRVIEVIRELTDDNVQILRDEATGPHRTIACERGLPQGSTLSPVLYTYFVDDLPSALGLWPGASARMYADDLAIKTSGSDGSGRELADYVSRLLAYAEAHGFEVNARKSELLGPRPVLIGEEVLQPKWRCRYLGVQFGASGGDFEYVHRKAVENAGFALRSLHERGLLLPQVDAERRLHLVKTFVLSRLDFGSALPLTDDSRRIRRGLYRRTLALAIGGASCAGDPLDMDAFVHADSPNVLASTGLMPFPARRGLFAWSMALQAERSGVPWSRCAVLVADAPFWVPRPAPSPAAVRNAALAWLRPQVAYRPLGQQSPAWYHEPRQDWVRLWLHALRQPCPQDPAWRAVLAATAALARVRRHSRPEFVARLRARLGELTAH